MTPNQIQQFKDAISFAVEQHILHGGKLMAGSFGNIDCRCPISCFTGLTQEGQLYVDLLSRKLGFEVTTAEMWDFIYGFDKLSMYNEMARVGAALRRKHMPVDKFN